jgi:hypothetical protein
LESPEEDSNLFINAKNQAAKQPALQCHHLAPDLIADRAEIN